jgi:hypothetical protein
MGAAVAKRLAQDGHASFFAGRDAGFISAQVLDLAGGPRDRVASELSA